MVGLEGPVSHTGTHGAQPGMWARTSPAAAMQTQGPQPHVEGTTHQPPPLHLSIPVPPSPMPDTVQTSSQEHASLGCPLGSGHCGVGRAGPPQEHPNRPVHWRAGPARHPKAPTTSCPGRRPGWCPAAGPQAAFTTGLLSEGAARGRQPAASLTAPSPPGQAALTSRLGGGHGAPVEGRAVPRHGPHLAVAPDGD